MTTLTASLAQANVPVQAVHAGTNVLQGQFVGVLSTSASGFILLAKVPSTATVTLIETHISAETAYTLNFGFRNGVTASATHSAFLGSAVLNVTNMSRLVALTAEETLNERFKYITASVQAGSRTTSVSLFYTVVYSMANPS